MDFQINRALLRPLLVSPKDERTGEFTETDRWVLDAPKRLPPTGQLREYVERAVKLLVPKSPSVAQRGPSWWNANWRETQIAVQIHPGFLHQVWWGEEPFVAKNNFHVLVFQDHVSQLDKELTAACLASAWGALSALFVSSEVGCEGVRWLSTSQLSTWPVLAPGSISRAHTTEVLRAYRLFRRLEAKEIPDMDETAVNAWLALTQAVAEAAGMRSPQAKAAECIALAKDACERRVRREAIALAGRLRKGGASGRSLAKHVEERIEILPSIPSILSNLTGGLRQIRLRSPQQLAQTAFDFSDDDTVQLGEGSLAALLGAGFECAPISRPNDPDYLARDVEEAIESVTAGLVGARPDAADPALFTYEETAADVRRAAVAWLKAEVEKRLS